MPIVRTYACEECGHFIEVTLPSRDWNADPPDCPHCAEAQMRQEFAPPRIIGSNGTKARDLAQTIANEDYHVADIQMDHRAESTPKVRYKDEQPTRHTNSTWGVAHAALESAIVAGRQTRLQYGSGLDILQQGLKDGSQPDLIEMSKRRCMRIY
jgi:putative FmdB family regulatory protein